MKYHDIWALSFEELKHNPAIINEYCFIHKLSSLVAFHMDSAVDFMENSACCHMRFKYPDCNIAVTRNDHLNKYMFELHVPIFH